MEYYVGLDVSLKQTSICVVDQAGLVVREGVVDSDPEAISVYVRSKAPEAVRIGLETGPKSTWLWTERRSRRSSLALGCLSRPRLVLLGSVACQIAKLKGHKVIGSAGGANKCAFLRHIGVDHVIDYKATSNLTDALLRAAPNGIDVYFDNVGGNHLEEELAAANRA